MKVGPRRPLAPDAEIIRALAGLLSETGLSEIEYAVGDHRIRVARESAGKAVLVNGHVNGGHANGAARHSAEPAEPEATGEAAPANAHGMRLDDPGLITAPLVGVAYLAPQPGAPPFVRVGDPVEKGQTLLIIEAMKVMNQIRAPRAGRLARILVTDADPVEYGAPLMLVE
ncbi:MAG: acetyl-CoA carboxylase biotin carboxyl carrier protein subunit [Alphaproteobacteria bacterium]